ncbi:hypothetical protein G5B41_15580 [bacterium SGD-2]|nr:hypothetical protein [bacterium SGD-2]
MAPTPCHVTPTASSPRRHWSRSPDHTKDAAPDDGSRHLRPRARPRRRGPQAESQRRNASAHHSGRRKAVCTPLVRVGIDAPDHRRGRRGAGGRALPQDSPIYDTLHNDTSHLKRFIPYFQKVLPELSPEEIYWRLHFSLGALHYTITSLSRLNALSDGACNTGCFEETLERIIDYVEAGFRMAPRPKSA